jgi:hypothetical protein
MPKDLRIGSIIYEYPTPGEPAGWSEGATSWAEGATKALETVQGPNDILLTSSTLNPENTGSFSNVAGLLFDAGTVQSFEVEFFVTRTFTDATPTEAESGNILGNNNKNDFIISVSSIGDAGIEFQITSTGQVQYKVEDRLNTDDIIIKFKAKTIDTLG